MGKKKVAILGITGMLGTAVSEAFSNTDYDLVLTTRKELDAQNADVSSIETLLNGSDYAINCIGIIKPYIHDKNSIEVQRAIVVNGLFPHKLATAALKTGTKVIQIATDCVYDGKAGHYDENSVHNAIDVYGKTKSLGEVYQENVLNLRCSIIGKEKKSYLSLLEWFLNQEKGSKVNGFENHYWNGVTTNTFAKLCEGIVKNDFWISGVQHVVPADILTKSDMLKIFAKVFEREDIQIEPVEAKIGIDRTLETVNKENNKILWQNAGYVTIPTIEDMIEEIK